MRIFVSPTILYGSLNCLKLFGKLYSVRRTSIKMPPKKKNSNTKPTPLMGRIGTSLKCGIVGLPNVGKSTFFNVLTKSAAAAENFPFCTIDPNENKGGSTLFYAMFCIVADLVFSTFGFISFIRRVPVPDQRFDWLCDHHKPASKVPAYLLVTDIAGLVQGASEGKDTMIKTLGMMLYFRKAEKHSPDALRILNASLDHSVLTGKKGLGNAFLSHISACDALFHVVRAFEDDDVTHVEDDVNPVRDLEIISEELRKKDEQYLNARMESMARNALRGGDKKAKIEYDILAKIHKLVAEEKKDVRFGDWIASEIEVLNKHLLLSSKPVIYLVNLSEKDYIRKKNKWLVKIKEWIDQRDPGALLIPFSGAFELNLLDMADDERENYLKEHKTTSALQKIIVTGFKTLQLQYFFTAGKDEVKAWTIQNGCKAPQAAGRIHTDFEKGFIMAEVMKFDDLKELGTESAVKAAGKYRQEGKNYVVHDGDVIFFKFNAGAGLTEKKGKK